jgi:hypothetical protein
MGLEGWRRGSESNRRIKVLQTSPLPLGYRAISHNCTAGPDRTRSGNCDSQVIRLVSRSKTEIFWMTHTPQPPCTQILWGNPAMLAPKVADWSGRRDLNPRPSPWQGDALPLSYSRIRPEAVYRAATRRSTRTGLPPLGTPKKELTDRHSPPRPPAARQGQRSPLPPPGGRRACAGCGLQSRPPQDYG